MGYELRAKTKLERLLEQNDIFDTLRKINAGKFNLMAS